MSAKFTTVLEFSSEFQKKQCVNFENAAYLTICTENGLHINFLDCNPAKKCDGIGLEWQTDIIQFKNSLVEPETEVDRKVVHENATYDETFHIMMDKTISPRVQSSVNNTLICSARFVPEGSYTTRPACAILSLNHQLRIYRNEKIGKWIEVVNLNILLEKALSESNFELLVSRIENFDNCSHNYEVLKNKSYLLAYVDLQWSPAWEHDGSFYCLLITMQKSGHVIIWKVSLPIHSRSFEIVEVLDLCNEIPSCSTIITRSPEHFTLFIGYKSGQLFTTSIKCKEKEIDSKVITPIWTEKDELEFTKILWLSKNSSLLCAKGVFLLIFNLYWNNEELLIANTTKYRVSPKHFISDMVFTDDFVLISCLDASFYKYVAQRVFKFNIEQEAAVVQMKWQTISLALSDNHIYLFEAAIPRILHDHLLFRKPFRLNMLPLKSTEAVVSLVLDSTGPLSNVADGLMFLKSYFHREKKFPIAIETLLAQSESWSTQARLQKLVRYFLCVKRTVADGEMLQLLNQQIDDLTVAILVEHCCRQLKELSSYKDVLSTASTNDLLSACLLCKYLDVYREFHPSPDALNLLIDRTIEVLNFGSFSTIQETVENCEVCGTEIPMNSITGDSCRNGHSFGRCAKTMLLCQDPKSRECTGCGCSAVSLHLQGSAWFQKLKDRYCAVCDFNLV